MRKYILLLLFATVGINAQVSLIGTSVNRNLKETSIDSIRILNNGIGYITVQEVNVVLDQFDYVVYPENSTETKIKWSSSDETIATVSQDGKITGISEGIATITITTEDGGHTDSHTLKVMQPFPKIDVNTAKEVEIDEAKNYPGQKLIIKPAYLHRNYETDIYYMLYLPETWEDNPHKRYPVFVDFQGMDWEPRKAYLGEALSYEFEGIWIGVCPIDADPEYDEDWTYNKDWDKKDTLTGMRVGGWWPKGGEGTPDFLLKNIREICEKFHGNTGQIFPIGMSKGAVCVNFYGNYNDEVADIWRGYFQHDGGIDGLRKVNNAPSLQAIWDGTVDGDGSFSRLERINGRPYLLTDFTYSHNREWLLGDSTFYSKGERTGRDYLGEHSTNEDYYVGEFQLQKWEINDAKRALAGVIEFTNAHTAEHLYSRIDYAQYTFDWFRNVMNSNIGCYHISGTITDNNGDPIEGAIIEGGGVHFAISNKRGEFFLEGLPKGIRGIGISMKNEFDFIKADRYIDLTSNVTDFYLSTKANYEGFQISVSSNNASEGTVSGAGIYTSGLTAKIKAKALPGYVFVNWTENGNEVSSGATYTFTVTGNRSLEAKFEKESEPNTKQ